MIALYWPRLSLAEANRFVGPADRPASLVSATWRLLSACPMVTKMGAQPMSSRKGRHSRKSLPGKGLRPRKMVGARGVGSKPRADKDLVLAFAWVSYGRLKDVP